MPECASTNSEVRAAQTLLREALSKLGVLCEYCGGCGFRVYGSTATWRGGVGGQSMTEGTCDRCWGTGRSDITGINQRAIEQKMRTWSEKQVLEYLGSRMGADLAQMREVILDLSKYCDKQSNRRKVPEGRSAFWLALNWHSLGEILRKIGIGDTGP